MASEEVKPSRMSGTALIAAVSYARATKPQMNGETKEKIPVPEVRGQQCGAYDRPRKHDHRHAAEEDGLGFGGEAIPGHRACRESSVLRLADEKRA